MLILCGLFVAFQSATGFLLGQLFFAHFSLPATLAGMAGLATSAGAFLLAVSPHRGFPWVRWAAVLSLLGVVLDIGEYYLYLNSTGNYYPWFLVGPFAACLAWVGCCAHLRLRQASP